jgi:16S rRNA C967 or C1407 C5-methylase (RsmB/RsmF family)
MNDRSFTFNNYNYCVSVSVLGPNPPYPGNTFDRILLDGPCSALGQRPCLANYMKLNEVKSFPVLQRKLFRNVSFSCQVLSGRVFCKYEI